jgi:hypothetical protein
VPAFGHADLSPYGKVRISAQQAAKGRFFALVRRSSRVSDVRFGEARIILFCGMLPLIWSFDHFYFGRVESFPDAHGWPA